MKPIKLTANELVIAVVPESCSGPGWSNRLVSVHIVDYADGKHRVVYLQPSEQPMELMAAFRLIEQAHLYAMGLIETQKGRK